jgi:putative zinc finger/helix-turn-helix YgiT family protein
MAKKKDTCLVCGTPMEVTREDVEYDGAMPDVILADLEVHRCPNCGEYEVAIPAIEQLHEVLAKALIDQPGRLGGTDIRFLRTYLGYSGVDFSKLIGVSPATLSRWENARDPIGEQADRLVRLMARYGKPVDEYPLEKLTEVSKDLGRPKGYKARRLKRAWAAEPIAAAA